VFATGSRDVLLKFYSPGDTGRQLAVCPNEILPGADEDVVTRLAADGGLVDEEVEGLRWIPAKGMTKNRPA